MSKNQEIFLCQDECSGVDGDDTGNILAKKKINKKIKRSYSENTGFRKLHDLFLDNRSFVG